LIAFVIRGIDVKPQDQDHDTDVFFISKTTSVRSTQSHLYLYSQISLVAHAMVVMLSCMWLIESATVSLIKQILLFTLDVQKPKNFQLQGLRPLTPWPGALPMDPAGGSAHRPPL